MDFDDLDETERELGPSAEEQRAELLSSARVETEEMPVPTGKDFAGSGKMKMLFMHGGGTNEKVSRMQIMNVFQSTWSSSLSNWKDNMEFDVWSGPHKVPLEWHAAPEMQAMLKMYGPDYWLYWDFDPPYSPNTQFSTWVGYDETMEALGEFLKENGPYDGMTGFDEGATCALQAALRAQKGDPAFAGMFRFMVLFTTYLPTVSSPLAARRPETPLRIPAFISWSETDHSRPYPVFEEIALFFEEERREIVRHSDGHVPPSFKPGMKETERLSAFLHCMKTGLEWKPSESPENSEFSGLFLPIVRTEPRVLESGATKKLLVFHEPDAGNRARAEKENVRSIIYAQVAGAAPRDFKYAAEAINDEFIELVSFDYTDDQKEFVFGTPRADLPKQIAGYCLNLDPQDVIAGDSAANKAEEIARDLLDSVSLLPGEEIGIVGVGHGALIALQAARTLVNGRNMVPAIFFVVNAPTAMPPSVISEGPGLLVDCPVRYLINEKAETGAPWRWELQTLGPFSTGLFTSREQMCKMVLEEFSAR